MKVGPGVMAIIALAAMAGARAADGQVQVRLGVPGRATYSALHEGLRLGTPKADTALRILAIRSPARLWRVARTAIDGDGNWNEGLLAFTRLAELRSAAYADSARRLRKTIENAQGNPFPRNP